MKDEHARIFDQEVVACIPLMKTIGYMKLEFGQELCSTLYLEFVWFNVPVLNVVEGRVCPLSRTKQKNTTNE